jgi:hydrogenase maturation protease
MTSGRPLGPGYLTGESRHVVVFACGDPLRGDDSVAPIACTSLPPETLARADVKLIGALEPEYLRDLPAGVRAVIVDAVVGPPAGEIVEMDLAEMSGRAEKVVTTSTHQLPLDQVVALAQLLRDEPVLGRFVGVGIDAVAIGEEPRSSVVDAVPALRDAVARAVAELDPHG